MPFRIALSGLNAATTDLEVTGNNIANAATNGFKESRAEFGDLYASAIQDTSNNAAGQGAQVVKVAQQFSQGSVDFTSNNLDLAISGQGFFVLENPDGTISYTRAGAYSVDRDGYVVNHANDRLQVYPAVNGVSGTTFSTGVLQDLQLPTTPSAPVATDNISASLNLNSSEDVPTVAFDPANPASYNSATSTTIYDSLGNPHTTTLYFVKTGSNAWDAYAYVDGNSISTGTTTPPASAEVSMGFSSSGALTSPASGVVTLPAFTPSGAAAMTIDLDLSSTTQYGAPFGVNNLSQNGYTSGRLAGVDIDTEGVIFARYTNGQSSPLGKVALAKFNNNQGLRQVGDTQWVESYESGSAQLGEAGTSSFGQIQSGALEASNVDVAEQLVNLITAQRNFQANAKTISTADAITQAVINLSR
ncbi:MAG: flagellar hook protein FlgE [Gammaproteobacteria bacterium]|nr:MAG: flagellar hook protein FlgE [Gammaproteobacteria bacterium]